MIEYPHIDSVFKRYMDGPNRGRLIEGEWTYPEFEYLAPCKWVGTEKVDGTNIRVQWYPQGVDGSSIPSLYFNHQSPTRMSKRTKSTPSGI